ncbi:MAG: hypothetical protein OM95_06550 [Bdellovibrio sp. ArHS]|uniref:hypothetical protein n=1 Tax=Bdellovibrio sp. ArHS TaxID=1569284 RepID=UPI000582B5B5|nr:hypothetical protein [Bdellovibrio sp. ArHS]KHD88784.1 MAG: hypothetical protein OM95_06550 [Bdellovibrio sp. ArHS]
MDESERQLYLERDYLHRIGVALNAALFIVDRLTEEIKEEEGRLETDSEIERLFYHLADYLLKIDAIVKTRNTHLSEILNNEIQKGKTEISRKNSPSSLV